MLDFYPLIEIENGGYFISSGVGSHPKRMISSWELIVVKKGTLYICENDTYYEVCENEALILSPNLCHWGVQPYEKDLKFFWLHFTFNQNIKKLPFPKYSRIIHPTRIFELFRWFLEDQDEGNKQNYKPFLLAMLTELSQKQGGGVEIPLENIPYLVQQAHILIKSKYATNISTDQIAEQLQCSPDYLGRIYKQYFNKTIIQALHHRRIQAAKDLLDHSSLNINEIARSVGFHDSSYFRRVFKDQLGISPNSYRKSFTKIHVNVE